MAILKVDLALAPEFDRFQDLIGNTISNDITAAMQASVRSHGDAGFAFSEEVLTLGLLFAALTPAVAVLKMTNLEPDENLANTIARLVLMRLGDAELQLVRKQ